MQTRRELVRLAAVAAGAVAVRQASAGGGETWPWVGWGGEPWEPPIERILVHRAGDVVQLRYVGTRDGATTYHDLEIPVRAAARIGELLQAAAG